MTVQLRIVRPVRSVERSLAMYCDGLGLREIDRFVDHQGFAAAIVGFPGLPYHFRVHALQRPARSPGSHGRGPHRLLYAGPCRMAALI
ncbi:hypothetical protein ACSFBI_16440 [Variovorax sp. RB3P1]|uniref:hypothetical protein n=1 Tax=Variovorax sp. RB3P1 TaxID=3443732 RepID=UPI003F44EE5A